MSLKIEISSINNAHLPEARTFPARGDKPARTVYEQKAYAHIGGAFPMEFKLTHDDHKDAYGVGFYEISPSSFKSSQYGQLQLDPYGLRLVPLNDIEKK